MLPIYSIISANENNYVKIQVKPDGKNCGYYDGVYVTKEAYDRVAVFQERAKKADIFDTDLRSNLDCYDAVEIFFIKEFPSDPEFLVEGFCEMFMGKIINKFKEKLFIPSEYHECFSTADVININDENNRITTRAAFIQPFKKGAIPLFRVSNPAQKQKNVVTEMINKKLLNKGYEDYIKPSVAAQHGLSEIIMIMVLLGNYSLHSGNILVQIVDNNDAPYHFYISIDLGAGIRKIFTSRAHIENENNSKWKIFNAIDDQFHKKYLHYYKYLPGLFESAVNHANTLSALIEPADNSNIFDQVINDALSESYVTFKESILAMGKDDAFWINDIRPRLLSYLYGENKILNLEGNNSVSASDLISESDDTIKNILIRDMEDIIRYRLQELTKWKRKDKELTDGTRAEGTTKVYDSAKKNMHSSTPKNTDDSSMLGAHRSSSSSEESDPSDAASEDDASWKIINAYAENDEYNHEELKAFDDMMSKLEQKILDSYKSITNPDKKVITEELIGKSRHIKTHLLNEIKKEIIEKAISDNDTTFLNLLSACFEMKVGVDKISPACYRFINALRTQRDLVASILSLLACFPQYADTKSYTLLLSELRRAHGRCWSVPRELLASKFEQGKSPIRPTSNPITHRDSIRLFASPVRKIVSSDLVQELNSSNSTENSQLDPITRKLF